PDHSAADHADPSAADHADHADKKGFRVLRVFRGRIPRVPGHRWVSACSAAYDRLPMKEPVIRGVGLVAALGYAAAIAWLYASQPQTMAQVTGGFASIVGAYTIDPVAFGDGLRF